MRISDWSSDVCSSDLTGLAGWRRADTEQGAERLRILDRIDDTARPFRTRQQRARADREFVDRLPVEMNVETAALVLIEFLDFRIVGEPVVRVRSLVESGDARSEEHTSELQSLMRISYAVFCLKKK